ncbi:MAG: hotdog domain-containing protein, partial [Polaromonas sp.]
SLGIEQQRLKESGGGMFIVSETSVRYLRPARLDDELLVTSKLLELGRASLIIGQQVLFKSVHGPDHAALPLCEGTIRIGWVDAVTLQPKRIPASILDSLKNGPTST